MPLNNKNIKFNKEKGEILLITIFMLGICLSIVLGVNIILISQLKTVSGIGNGVAAFYMADAGLEMQLYMNRKITKDNQGNTINLGICGPAPSNLNDSGNNTSLASFLSQVKLNVAPSTGGFSSATYDRTTLGTMLTTCTKNTCGGTSGGCIISYSVSFPGGASFDIYATVADHSASASDTKDTIKVSGISNGASRAVQLDAPFTK